ncbi:MAG: metallophosphoesterase [Nitrospirae bacterium]|nr:metallophosphoesterase [Nitrospirota bacterium]
MERSNPQIRTILAVAATLLALPLFPSSSPAVNPNGARHSSDPNQLFWFIQVGDSHVGENFDGGTQDSEYLNWLVTEARTVVNPAFIALNGDLTDSTNGGLIPNGPHQAEWNEYKGLVDPSVNATNFFDAAGNHDQYNDGSLSYYLNNSIQGRATQATQQTWIRTFAFGKYAFVNVSTPGDDGASWPFDHAGLRAAELAFMESYFGSNMDSKLLFIFGHHPSNDFNYGKTEFLNDLKKYRVAVYAYGHTHSYNEGRSDQVFHLNVASLGKSSGNHYNLVAVDNNGVSIVAHNAKDWPAVLITTPVDRNLGGSNPYAYPLSKNSTSNALRAIVFDKNPVTSVSYKIDSGGLVAMSQVAPGVWQASWDSTGVAVGQHTLTVQAVGSATRSDAVTFDLKVTACDDGLDNDGDGKTDYPADPKCYGESDDSEGNCDYGTDADLDGSSVSCDCNDTNPYVSPNHLEITGNGVDDDCNPNTPDEGGGDGGCAAEPVPEAQASPVLFISSDSVPHRPVMSASRFGSGTAGGLWPVGALFMVALAFRLARRKRGA